MAKDRVTNIRIRFAKMTPYIYDTFALPEDAELLRKLTECVRALSAENCNDVAGPTKDLLIKIMNSTSKQNIFRWDLQTIQAKRDQDRKRETEENSILTEWELMGGVPDAQQRKNSKMESSGDSLTESGGSSLKISTNVPKKSSIISPTSSISRTKSHNSGTRQTAATKSKPGAPGSYTIEKSKSADLVSQKTAKRSASVGARVAPIESKTASTKASNAQKTSSSKISKK